MTGESISPNLGDRYVISETLRSKITKELFDRASKAGEMGFELSEIDEVHRAVLLSIPDLRTESSRVYSSKFGRIKDALASHPYIKELERSPFKPPSPDGIDRQQLRELVRQGLVIDCDGTYFSPTAVSKAKETIWNLSQRNDVGFTVSELRDELETSRKYLLALIGHLDAQGFTRRNGDLRKPGPALIREFTGM